ncbi:MAG: translocation/assembly module TamB [Flavobacteriaceae bacterium]|jgi:hypothetical protein|nr:translocation/assembly module TamB [Flavobacteriaceae bacterium]
MTANVKKNKKLTLFQKILKRILYAAYVFLFLFLALLVVLNTPYMKEKIAHYAVDFLNNKFKTQIAFQSVEVDYLGNVVFHNLSAKDHHSYEFIKIKELKAYTNTLSLIRNTNKITIDELKLTEPVVRVITYKGEEKDNFTIFTKKFQSKEKSPRPFYLNGRVDLVNGQLSIVNQNLTKKEQTWLDASNLNVKIPSLKIADSDVTANVAQFSFDGKRRNEKYQLKQLSGSLHYSNTDLSFKDLTLESNTSLLLGNLTFTRDAKNGFEDFANRVHWALDLKDGSKISGSDLRYFVPIWTSNAAMNLCGTADGVLNNLTLKNPVVSGNNTFYSAAVLNLKDLVSNGGQKKFSINTQNAHLQTSLASLKTWLPKSISEKIPDIVSKFGTANYRGNLSLTKSQIVSKGSLISALGGITADASLSDYSSAAPKYKGTLIANNFNLAPLTNTQTVGAVTGNITFDGSGFKPENINTSFNGVINQIVINGKSIASVTAAGSLRNKLFDGQIHSQDPNANLDFDGTFDFSQEMMTTDFEAQVKRLNVNYFADGLTQDMSFSGKIKSNLKFSSWDDLTGHIDMQEITLTSQEKPTYFDDIQIKTGYVEGHRELDIYSQNMISANIYGNYKLKDVPEMLKNGVGNLLVDYRPKKEFKNQEFTFVLDVQEKLFDLFMLDVNISSGTTITGKYDGNDNQLQAQLISEYIYYKNFKVIAPNLYLNTASPDRQLFGSIASFYSGNTKIDGIDLSGYKKNDSLFAATTFRYGKDNPTKFNVNLYQTREGNDLIFGFRPSDIALTQAKWTINPDFKPDESIAKYNLITQKLTLEKVVARSGNAEIDLTGMFHDKNNFDFDLNMLNVKLEQIIPQDFLKGITFKGTANGTAKVVKNSKEFSPLVDITIDSVSFNNQPLGNLALNASYDLEQDRYIIDSKLTYQEKNNLLAKGTITNKAGKSPQIDLTLSADKFNIAPIGTFLQGIFSNFRGTATGEVTIAGDINKPKYQGILTMEKVGFKVIYLGVDYQLTQPQDLQISDGTFLLDNIELMDTGAKTKGIVSGMILTRNFKEWGLNLECESDKMLVLHTTEKDNDLFFGTVYAKGKFYIGGPVQHLEISTEVKKPAVALAGSELTINTSSTTVVSDVKFIKFIPEQFNADTPPPPQGPTGLVINLSLSANQESLVRIIIDSQTEDRLEVHGITDNLKFNMNEAGKITMDGKYTIKENSYYYFQTFLNKKFTIKDGSSIIWDGRGPTTATLDITASYDAVVSNIGDYLNIPTVPATNVTVLALLKGNLAQPQMAFNIEADTPSAIKEDLKSKLSTNEERLQQSAGIVLTGGFIAGNMTSGNYASSAYGVVLKQLTNAINGISKNFNIDVGYIPGSSMNQTSDMLSFAPALQLNSRIKIVGSFNVPLEQKSASDVLTAGGSIDIDISKSGNNSLVFSGFSQPSTFGIESTVGNTSNQANGVRFVFKKSLNRLFPNRRNRNSQTPVDSTAIKQDTAQAEKKTLKNDSKNVEK